MYKQLNDKMILRLADKVHIPVDPDNKDYQKYLAWLEKKGNEPEPSDPDPPPPFPELADWQFIQGLAYIGQITIDEAKAWVARGKLPASVTAFIGTLPEEQRFQAEMILCGAKTYLRANPLVDQFGTIAGMTPAQLNDFWFYCAGLNNM